jgi:tRNA pseudouridine38-40 synthase
MRFAIQLSYKGTNYFGWQRQPKQVSVQGSIEENLSKVFQQDIQIVGCGRTDTGVHAHDYYAHVDLPDGTDPEKLMYKLNRMLPLDIAFHRMFQVSDEWHARFLANARSYRYFVHQKKNAFLNETSWYVAKDFDLDKMNEACQYLIGKKDFTSLSKLHTDVKTNICDVRSAKWVHIEDDKYYFEIVAERFLRNMVRATVGTLMDVGLGKLQPEDMERILNALDRGSASISVPPQGLFLWEISYPSW